MPDGSTTQDPFGEVPIPDGKVKAAPVTIPKGEGQHTQLKEAFGRVVVFGIYANDPMATLSPMIWLAVPLLKAAGKGEQYKDRITKWKKGRDDALRDWNVRNGMWKTAKATAEDTIEDLMEVAIRENIILITKSMWDIAKLAGGSGDSGPDGAPTAGPEEPRIG